VYDEGPATETNSLLVTFDLAPSGDGTLLRFKETGFRERGWEAAVLEEAYHDHVRLGHVPPAPRHVRQRVSRESSCEPPL